MNRSEALEVLGLAADATDQQIFAALDKKRQLIQQKQAEAPSAALQAKYAALESKLEEIEQLLAGPAVPSQSHDTAVTPSSRTSVLSQTKLADLPQGQQSYTGFDSGIAAAQVHLQPGQRLANRYEIREQIGAGGMGAVYHAFDHTKQEDIALKVLLPALIQNERARQRFLDEARISARLSHPNIVNVFDVQQDGDYFFLTMELLRGQDLRQLMESRKTIRDPFTEQELDKLAVQLGNALVYAHQYTVHRDIKPENIWVTEDGDYKLMDFGIARVQSGSQRTQTGAAMGTAYYMAPEQLRGQGNIDGRADIYAIGVLLYELALNDVPVGAIQPLQKKRKDISKRMSDVVMRCLQPDPDSRFADAAGFVCALSERSTRGLSAVLSGKFALVASLMVVLLLAGGTGWFFLVPTDPQKLAGHWWATSADGENNFYIDFHKGVWVNDGARHGLVTPRGQQGDKFIFDLAGRNDNESFELRLTLTDKAGWEAVGEAVSIGGASMLFKLSRYVAMSPNEYVDHVSGKILYAATSSETDYGLEVYRFDRQGASYQFFYAYQGGSEPTYGTGRCEASVGDEIRARCIVQAADDPHADDSMFEVSDEGRTVVLRSADRYRIFECALDGLCGVEEKIAFCPGSQSDDCSVTAFYELSLDAPVVTAASEQELDAYYKTYERLAIGTIGELIPRAKRTVEKFILKGYTSMKQAGWDIDHSRSFSLHSSGDLEVTFFGMPAISGKKAVFQHRRQGDSVTWRCFSEVDLGPEHQCRSMSDYQSDGTDLRSR